MKTMKYAVVSFSVVMLLVSGACKHSGVGVTNDARIAHLSLEVPTDLSDGETKELTVALGNRGVGKIKNVRMEVEIPNELVVLSVVPGGGINMSEGGMTSTGRLYHFEAGDIEVASSSEIRFHVRASFGALDQTGEIKVTAFASELPNGSLVETKVIKARR